MRRNANKSSFVTRATNEESAGGNKMNIDTYCKIIFHTAVVAKWILVTRDK